MPRTPTHRLPTRCWISALVLLVTLGGCATSKEHTLPQDGPTMQDIYEEHFGRLSGHSLEGARAVLADPAPQTGNSRPVQPAELDLAGYTRTAYNEIDAIFPRLPNPTLVMFVFPHLAGAEAVPVPGYSTTFPLYEQVEYALPGEVPLYGQP